MIKSAAELLRELARERDSRYYEVVQGFLGLDRAYCAGDRFLVFVNDPEYLVYRDLEAHGIIERCQPQATCTITTAT